MDGKPVTGPGEVVQGGKPSLAKYQDLAAVQFYVRFSVRLPVEQGPAD